MTTRSSWGFANDRGMALQPSRYCGDGSGTPPEASEGMTLLLLPEVLPVFGERSKATFLNSFGMLLGVSTGTTRDCRLLGTCLVGVESGVSDDDFGARETSWSDLIIPSRPSDPACCLTATGCGCEDIL